MGQIMTVALLLMMNITSSNAQEEPGLDVCFDPNACNYTEIIFNSPPPGLIGIGFCVYPEWYIPNRDEGFSGPAVLVCEDDVPVGYITADQECLIYVISQDLYCVRTQWDGLCQDALNSCLESGIGCNDPSACNYVEGVIAPDNATYCDYEQWWIPIDHTVSDEEPAILACLQPVGYQLAQQCCAEKITAEDNFCVETDWDTQCNNKYETCLATSVGCTQPLDCNYDPFACVDDGSCVYVLGCTYKAACNYNALATMDDGSCAYPVCTDPTAINYNPFSPCLSSGIILLGLGGGGPGISGDCYYESPECPGDFDGNGSITTTDLTGFLAVFGSDCQGQGGK